jgi:hypothetical protein
MYNLMIIVFFLLTSYFSKALGDDVDREDFLGLLAEKEPSSAPTGMADKISIRNPSSNAECCDRAALGGNVGCEEASSPANPAGSSVAPIPPPPPPPPPPPEEISGIYDIGIMDDGAAVGGDVDGVEESRTAGPSDGEDESRPAGSEPTAATTPHLVNRELFVLIRR